MSDSFETEILEIDLVEQVAGVLGVAIFHSVSCQYFLLAAAGWQRRLVAERRVASRTPDRRFRCLVAAFIAAADLLQRVEPFEHEIHARGQERRRRLRRNSRRVRQFHQALHFARAGEQVVGAGRIGQLQAAAQVEPFDNLPCLEMREVAVGDAADGRANQFARDRLGALELALVFHLELARNRRQRGIDVGDAGHRDRFAVHQRPPLGIGDDVLDRGDGQALAHSRSLVDAAILPCLERDLFHDLGDERRHLGGQRRTVAGEPRFLRGNRHAFGAAGGVVRANLGSDPVLQRRDDLAARGVVLGIRGERHQHVERQPDRVALNLDVAFLQDVEQSDLDLAGEIGQLVDGENAAVRPRQQPVVHRQFAREVQARLRRLDRIDIADHVGDRHVGRRQLFDVAGVASEPCDRRVIALGRDPRDAPRADRGQRIVVDLAAGHDRDRLVEQRRERAQQARLRLAAQPEQNEVVARQQRVDELRNHRVVVADDAREEGLAGAELGDEVLPHFLVDAAPRHLAVLDGAPKLADRGHLGIRHKGILLKSQGTRPKSQGTIESIATPCDLCLGLCDLCLFLTTGVR